MLAFVWRKSESCKCTRSQQPYSTFPGRFSVYKSESAWIAQTYGRPQNYTKLRRAFCRNFFFCANRPKEILANRNRQFFAQNRQFLPKHGHTRRRAELSIAALQADSLSTCCEWQKRDRAMKPVLYKMTNDKFALSRFCHSQQVLNESACSAATHNSARRRVWPVCAKFVCFTQKNAYCDLPKFPLACLRKICGGMPSSTSYSSVSDHTFARPRPIRSW